MHSAPEQIWLQIDPDGTDPTEEFLIEGATWCQDKINESDVEYVRADDIDRLRAEVAKLRELYSSALETCAELNQIHCNEVAELSAKEE